jgi:hypothetical protein
MRFLLFNVTVTAALIYLFAVGGPGVAPSLKGKAEDLLATLTAAAGEAIDKISDPSPGGGSDELRGQATPESPRKGGQPDRTTALVPAAGELPAVDASRPPPPPPSPTAAPIEPERSKPLQAPTVSRKPEAARAAPSPSADPVTPSRKRPRFMTPRERRRELQRLARDMEELFVNRLGP